MRRISLAVVVSAALFLPGLPAAANDLDDAVTRMAKNIKSFLMEDGQKTVELRDFSGPGGSTGGRAIRSELERNLKAQDVEVVSLGAGSQIRGEFELRTGQPVAMIMLRAIMVDRTGREVATFRERVGVQEVTDPEDITRLLGSTVDLRDTGRRQSSSDAASVADASPNSETSLAGNSQPADPATQLISASREKSSKIEQSTIKPTFVSTGEHKSIIAASPNSPFKVELLVRRSGQSQFVPLAMEDQGGFPFATLEEGDVYRVRIHNEAQHNVGVKILIDGINTFTLSEVPEFRELGAWLVSAGGKPTITGWYVDPNRTLEFLVSSAGDQSRLPPPSDLGTITAQFFHAWGAGDPTPQVELATARSQQSGLKTVPGREVTQRTRISRSHIGKQLLGSVSLRYSRPPVDLPDSVSE